jgi:hypothetical protein
VDHQRPRLPPRDRRQRELGLRAAQGLTGATGGYVRSTFANQADTPSALNLVSARSGLIEATLHPLPPGNAARNSAWLTGWGPTASGGPTSLKQSTYTVAPRPVTDARLATYSRRSSVQVKGVAGHEVGVDAARRGLLARDRQRGFRDIDSDHAQSERRNVKGVLAGPASGIENRAPECAFARQTHDRRLWSPGVPRRRAVDVRGIPRLARPPLVTGRAPARGPNCRL